MFLERLTPHVLISSFRSLYWGLRLHSIPPLFINGRITIDNPKRVTIGTHTSLNEGVHLGGKAPITIGAHVHLSAYVSIHTGGLVIERFRAERTHTHTPVIIEDGVWVGANALINPGVRLGHDCVIGAGAVVTKDIPPYAVAVGVPARIVRFLNAGPESTEK